MIILIGAIGILAIISALIMVFSPKKQADSQQGKDSRPTDDQCCGAHETCDSELLKKLSEEIIYFEDQELDSFQEREANSYKDEEIEQFREVLYTLKKEEINDWLHSIELRQIHLPETLKAEVIMLLND